MSYIVSPYVIRLDALATRDLRHLGPWDLKSTVERSSWLMPNDGWSGMKMGYFDAVDEALRNAGSDVRLLPFFQDDPTPRLGLQLGMHDFPMIGHVPHTRVASLRAALDLPLEGQPGESVAQFREWLSEAETERGDLITFYG